MTRVTKTLRLDESVDDWIDDFSEENSVDRSDVVNRAIKVYAAKQAKGEWSDPKFKDSIDEVMDNMS